MTDTILAIIVTIILAAYGGLGAIAKHKYEKFKTIAVVLTLLSILTIILSSVWDLSALIILSKLHLVENSEKILNGHVSNRLFSMLLPCITTLYVWILNYVFKTHSNDDSTS